MVEKNIVPQNYAELRELIIDEYDSLSNRLKQAAEFALDNPIFFAVEKMQSIANVSGVHISTLVRLASALGFSKFSEMQLVFKKQILHQSNNYSERLRGAQKIGDIGGKSSLVLCNELSDMNIKAIDKLCDSITEYKLDLAVALMDKAETIYIQGVRRAYPIAFYLSYILMKFDANIVNVVLVDGHGGMQFPLTKRMSVNDIVIAVTYMPYAEETTHLFNTALRYNIPVISITDDAMTEQNRKATVCFEIPEGEVIGFRSLSNSLNFAQALAVNLMIKKQNKQIKPKERA